MQPLQWSTRPRTFRVSLYEEASWQHTASTENIRNSLKGQGLRLWDSPSGTLSPGAPTSYFSNENVRWGTTSMIGCALNTN
jgi:hypothetical protein